MTRHFDYDPHLCSGNNQSVGLSVPKVSRLLRPGNRIFLEVASMVTTWWIVAFLCSDDRYIIMLVAKDVVGKFEQYMYTLINNMFTTDSFSVEIIKYMCCE